MTQTVLTIKRLLRANEKLARLDRETLLVTRGNLFSKTAGKDDLERRHYSPAFSDITDRALVVRVRTLENEIGTLENSLLIQSALYDQRRMRSSVLRERLKVAEAYARRRQEELQLQEMISIQNWDRQR